MAFTITTLLLAALGVLWWFASTEAHEHARSYAQAACAKAGVQLLDGTVVLRRLRLRRAAEGFFLERRYAFEFSPDGITRVQGWIELRGRELRSATVPFSAPSGQGPI